MFWFLKQIHSPISPAISRLSQISQDACRDLTDSVCFWSSFCSWFWLIEEAELSCWILVTLDHCILGKRSSYHLQKPTTTATVIRRYRDIKMVYEVKDKTDFKSQLSAAGNKLVVVDFYATWWVWSKLWQFKKSRLREYSQELTQPRAYSYTKHLKAMNKQHCNNTWGRRVHIGFRTECGGINRGGTLRVQKALRGAPEVDLD